MDRNILVAAHRGHFGGGIVENTIPAFEAAIRCGADIVEMDIRKTADGQLVLFHDPSPMRLLGLPGQTERYTLRELTARPLLNTIGELSDSYVCRLEDALDALKGRCMINFDQCWGFVDEVYAAVHQRGMDEQALIKGRVPYDGALDWLRANAYKPTFIPIITCEAEIAAYRALPEQIRMPMVELFVHTDDDPVWNSAFVEEIQKKGSRIWINSLSLSSRFSLCAWHDDNRAVTGDPDGSWGELIARGAGVIQTDWTGELAAWLVQRHNR